MRKSNTNLYSVLMFLNSQIVVNTITLYNEIVYIYCNFAFILLIFFKYVYRTFTNQASKANELENVKFRRSALSDIEGSTTVFPPTQSLNHFFFYVSPFPKNIFDVQTNRPFRIGNLI